MIVWGNVDDSFRLELIQRNFLVGIGEHGDRLFELKKLLLHKELEVSRGVDDRQLMT
jgi:hypothetical protein